MVARQQKKWIGGMAGVVIFLLTACGGGSGGGVDASVGMDGGGSEKTGGVTVSNIFSQAKELGVGDLMYVDFSKESSLDFSGVPSNSEFIFVLANTSSGGNFSVQMNADLVDADLALEKSLGDEEEEGVVEEPEFPDLTASFHEALRDHEEILENLTLPSESSSMGKSAAGSAPEDASIQPAASIGEKRTFKVLSSLNSSSNTVEVSASAECIDSNIVFYVDDRVGQDMLSDADISTLCSQFNASSDHEKNLFGDVSDVNGDGKVAVLFTPQVNRLGAQGGGIITGFFSASDLYPSSSANPASNAMEILYVMIPDPAGTYGVNISREFAMSNLLPTVLVHELQHAISYNQHVFVKGGVSERAWLNEGMSHLSEDIFGQGQENPSRYNIFLRNPQSYSLVTSGSPGLAARGAAFLFLRFLYEQHGNPDQFLKSLIQTAKTGTDNVEAAFAGDKEDFDNFGEFFLRWNVALAMTDQGISQDRRFTYQPRLKDSQTGNWKGVCLYCSAEDHRGTVLTGVSSKSYTAYQSTVTAQSAARYYALSRVNGQMKFSGISGEGFGVLIRKK